MVGKARPLVVLTREPADNRPLARQLEHLGIATLEIPCLATEMVLPTSWPRPPFAALAFSSKRAVGAVTKQGLWPRLEELAPGALTAAVGPATARALRQVGRRVELVAASGDGAGLGRQLLKRLPAGARVLGPGGEMRAGGLAEVLQAAGITFETVVVYRNREPEIARLEPCQLAGVMVASPSAARRLLARNPWMRDKTFFTIGNTTARELTRLAVESVVILGVDTDDWARGIAANLGVIDTQEEP